MSFLNTVGVEEDVGLLVILILVLSNAHVVGEISSNLALDPHECQTEENLLPEVEHEALSVLLQLLLVLLQHSIT